MQFVRGGPDIPNELVHLHEEGSVVFFTGAGISYPAGLPGFGKLTELVYKGLNMTRNGVEDEAFKACRYDTTLGLLESRLRGQRATMREQVAKALIPDLSKPNALRTHRALLQLGRARSGALRLVTTNFDRLFDEASADSPIKCFAAPLLPVPKNAWDGLVYLHGRLRESNSEGDLDQLVISSGDFGIAYLAERWAARFVSELFRNYTVCFVGYSIEDPVLRYMMDALAADELLGEHPKRMYAFARVEGDVERSHAKWRSKGVDPILYSEHEHLHETLNVWSAVYRDGILGKEALVVQLAGVQPETSTPEDDVIGRMLWALSDTNDAPAKRFADLDPLPTLAWLGPLTEERFGSADLVRFGILSTGGLDDELKFSLLSRPSSHRLAQRQALVAFPSTSGVDQSLDHLARWLSRHAHDPALLLWVCRKGGLLHRSLAWYLNQRLHGDDLPSVMNVAWRLVLAGRMVGSANSLAFYEWNSTFQKEGMTARTRSGLREILTPRLALGEHTIFSQGAKGPAEAQSLRELFDVQVTLTGVVEQYTFTKLDDDRVWQAALPDLTDDATALLRDAVHLMEETGLANEEYDRSSLAMPSISEHAQNRHFDSWTLLIRLCRDAWLALVSRSPDHARWVVEGWAREKFPVFRRLVLFASTIEQVIPTSSALKHLLETGHSPLWSFETRREAFRLIVSLASRLTDAESQILQDAILIGPPRVLFRSDMIESEWDAHRDRSIWIRLAKFHHAGGKLTDAAQSEYDGIKTRLPTLALAEDESDEFHMHFGDVIINRPPSVRVPEELDELVEYLRAHPTINRWEEDNFAEFAKRNAPVAIEALSDLGREGLWLSDRWKEALFAWADESIAPMTWLIVSPALLAMPDDALHEMSHALGFWLKRATKAPVVGSELFELIGKIISPFRDEGTDLGDDPLTHAINDPVGMAAEAALSFWYAGTLKDGIGLAQPVRSLFEELCDATASGYRTARVLLGAHAVSLYRVDPDWTRQYLLPHFNWDKNDMDAFAVWYGLLWSGNVHWALYEELKPQFVKTAQRSSVFGDTEERIAGVIAVVAISDNSPFDRRELIELVHQLSNNALKQVLFAMRRSVDGSGAQKEAFWTNRIVPFIREVWPNAAEKNDDSTGEEFALLVLSMRDRMKEALEVTKKFLGGNPGRLVLHELNDSSLCRTNPDDCLELLFRMNKVSDTWSKDELNKALEAILVGDFSLRQDPRYLQLRSA